jgi:hypothetical protein
MDNRQVDVIEARVQGAIRDAIAIAKREKRGDAGYTIAVKESLTGLGHELGYVGFLILLGWKSERAPMEAQSSWRCLWWSSLNGLRI